MIKITIRLIRVEIKSRKWAQYKSELKLRWIKFRLKLILVKIIVYDWIVGMILKWIDCINI